MGKYDNNWRKIFPKSAIDAGWEYYLQGKAKNLVETDYGFHARVRGKRNYQVDIFTNDNHELEGGDCNCTEALKGEMCKHMAAALYLIESIYIPIRGINLFGLELDFGDDDDIDYDPDDEPEIGTSQNYSQGAGRGSSQSTTAGTSSGRGRGSGSGRSQGASSTKTAGSSSGKTTASSQSKSQRSSSGRSQGASSGKSQGSSSGRGQGSDSGKSQGSNSGRGQGSKSGKTTGSWFDELDRIQKEETRLYLEENPSAELDIDMEEYRYFHYQGFRDGLDIPRKSLQDGKAILATQGLRDIRVEVGFSSNIEHEDMIGMITGKDVYGYQYTRLFFDRNRITDGYCNIWSCRYQSSKKSRIGHKLCEHEAALLLYLEDYMKTYNVGDSSNQNGIKLINYMTGSDDQGLMEQEEKGQILTLVPILHYDEGKDYRVSFKVGAKRLYVVKNLSEFMENVNDNKVMLFGQKTKFLLGRAWFDPFSLSALEFIEHALEEDAQLRRKIRQGYEEGLPRVTSEIPLYGNNLDEFFDLMGPDRPFEFIEKSYYGEKEKKTLTCRESDYQANLSIKMDADQKTGAFQGIRMTGQFPSFLFGQRYAYYIEDNCICRIPIQKAKGLKPLLAVQRGNQIDVKIGRRHLADFYGTMLPKIREVADVQESDVEVIRRYLPAEPVFKCYLDVAGDEIFCRVDAIYGNKVHHLIEEIVFRDVTMNYRNMDKETDLLNFLHTYFPNIDEEHMVIFGEKDEENVFLFLSEGLVRLLEVAEVHMTDRFRRLGIRRNIKYNVGVSVDSNILDIDITSMGYSRQDLMEILNAYKRKATYIRLKNGDFLKIDQNESVAALAEIMESLHLTPREFVKGKMHIPAYRALYLEKMMEQSQFIEADRSKTFRKLIREFDTATNADYDLPPELETVLRNYQKDGYQWLRTLDHLGFGGILADEMGLGKTLQVITVLLAESQERAEREGTNQAKTGREITVAAGSGHTGTGQVIEIQEGTDQEIAVLDENGQEPAEKTALIVCPASLVYNWGEELSRFAPQLTVSLAAGTKSERKIIIAGCMHSDVLITSYDLLKRDIDLYEDKSFRFMILDEAQYIKNQQTAAAKSVKLIKARTRYALTGTPIENRLSDMWSIFDFLMPGFLFTYPVFRQEYEIPIVKDGQKELSERLSRMASPFILRRKKMTVLKDLPEKLEEIRYAGMGKTQKKLYDAHVVRLRKSLEKQSDEEFSRNRIQVLAELTKLRQICCDPSLYYADYDGESAKREACMSLVESIVEGEHKALIFSQFTTMLELLEKDLNEAGIPYYKITGSTPKEKRFALVNTFNADDTPIFLISLKAGGTGLNLTGADVVIHYDPWWNQAVQNQATDRVHRIGQTQIVTVYKLIIKGTIEEKIVEMQESKKQLAEDILGGENISSSIISKEDLLALL